MRIDILASYAEWLTKGDDLIKALVDEADKHNPDLADRLSKALPPKEQELKHRVLRGMHKESKALYSQYTKAMIDDIMKVVESGIEKADDDTAPLKSYAHDIYDKDEALYMRVRAVLKQYGYEDFDFENKEGRLYGKSINELRELIKEKS